MTSGNKQGWSNSQKYGILIHNNAKGLRVRLRRPAVPYTERRKKDLQEVFAMLDQAFQQVYTKFKLHFYQQVFSKFENREATLTTVESFCMEVIMALGHPTIAEFSNMMHLSTPNAAYKINNLVKKGMSKKYSPVPTSGSITCTPRASTLTITASATPTCKRSSTAPSSALRPRNCKNSRRCCAWSRQN